MDWKGSPHTCISNSLVCNLKGRHLLMSKKQLWLLLQMNNDFYEFEFEVKLGLELLHNAHKCCIFFHTWEA